MSNFFAGNLPQTPEEVPLFLQELSFRLEEAFNGLEAGHKEVLHVEPSIPQIGQLVYADGTDWNPGSGEGLYRYSLARTWVYLETDTDTDQTPTGSVSAFAASTPPTGWLECDGAAVNRTTYAALFAVISDDYGPGNGTTTFNLPDMRGEVPRGWDHGAGNDPDAASRTDRGDGTTGDNVGTKQADEFKSHTHPSSGSTSGTRAVGAGVQEAAVTGSATGATGGNETRGRNVALMFIIKT